MAFEADSYSQALAPSALSQFRNVSLSAGELALTVFSVEQEAGEITETIKDQPRNLACNVQTILGTFMRRRNAAIAT